MQSPKVSIILPVYKNRDTLQGLYSQLSNILESEIEFVFVDDACPENSLEFLKELVAIDDRITVIGLANNLGQQNAVLVGLRYAQGEIAIIMDADLQDPPKAIPKLLAKLSENYDVVFAGRRGKYQIGHRLLTSRLYKWSLHFLLGLPTDAGLFMALRRDVINQLIAMSVKNPHLVAMIGVLKIRSISIPTERSQRPTGISAYTSWMRLKIGVRTAFWALFWRLGIGRKKTSSSIFVLPTESIHKSKYMQH